jgi:hypothetical protein
LTFIWPFKGKKLIRKKTQQASMDTELSILTHIGDAAPFGFDMLSLQSRVSADIKRWISIEELYTFLYRYYHMESWKEMYLANIFPEAAQSFTVPQSIMKLRQNKK